MDPESLEGLNLNYKELRSLIEILDTKNQHLDSRAGHLAGAYLVYQLIIIYIKVNLPSAALPGKRWIPACLSALVSAAFWLTFVTTVNRSLKTRRQQDSTFMEQERLYRKMYSIKTGRKVQSDGGANAVQQSLAKPFATLRCQRYAFVGAVHSTLFSITLLVSYALI